MLLMGIGTMKALAADYLYVITDGNGNYLANSSGSIANATSFDPKTCVWTCTGSSSGNLTNNNYYLNYSSNTLTLNNSSSSRKTSWTISSNNVSCTSGRNTYYIYISNSSWSATSTQSSASKIYTVTKLTTDAVSSMTLDYDAGRKSNKLGEGENVFEREGDSRDYTIDLSYTPAYNTYSWTTTDNAEVKYYTSSDDSYITDTAAPDAITEATSCEWSSNYPDNVTFKDEDESSAMAEYTTKFSTDTNVTITATATISKEKSSFMTTEVTLTASDTVKLLSHILPDLQYKVDSLSLYIGQTTQITYKGYNPYDVPTVTYTSSNTDIAEVSADGVITAKGVGTNDKDAESVVITATTPQTDDYEASSASITITVMKHPTTMTLNYDKSALTYGETAPALTALTLKDNVDNSDITNASVSYSSNNTCVNVNASTGELTILSAGTAIITATYSGDDTHMKAEAKFTVTVSKATTTLSFEHDSYLAQLTHPNEFTSPTATISPVGAGTVTYSYTSTPADLITLNTSTGTVTLGTETGTAIVTATFAGNDKYEPSTATYVLTVSSKELPDFSISIGKQTFYVDETTKVTVTTNSKNGYSLSSSNDDVITVDENGNVKAVGEGKAYLNIISKEDDTYMEINAKYDIEVNRYPTKITFSYPQTSYYTDHDGRINPTVEVHETVRNYLADTEGLISYSTDENDALTVDSKTGQVTLLGKDGKAAITVTYAGNYKYAPQTANVVLQIKKVVMPGTFIRLKDASGNYLASDGSTVGASSSDADASSIIWYGEDRSLLFYQCGLYLKDATPSLADVVTVGGTGTSFKFSHNLDNYYISDGKSNLKSGDSDIWTMEEAEYLPLTFGDKSHGYATLYSPTDLTCPAGVVAYYPTTHTSGTSTGDYVITLQSVTGGYIPHNTPVVLKTSYVGTYKFYIVDETDHGFDDIWDGLVGTIPAITTESVYSDSQWPYTLQPLKSTEAVGFYPWKRDKHESISPFRCYIPGAKASSAKSFRFVMDDDTADGISDITAPSTSSDESGIYYNLQGIPVGTSLQSLPSGIYIQDGRKILKD